MLIINKMGIYFYREPYNVEKMSEKIEELEFKTKELKYIDCYHLNEIILISFTNPKKGIIQIQGKGIIDILENGEKSQHYSDLEKLAKSLQPQKILNEASEEVHTELTQK